MGMHLCVAGWMDGGKVGYPICFPSLKCGENHVGLVMYRDPVPQSSKYDAYCYRLDGTRTCLYSGVATCTGLMALIIRDLLSECPPPTVFLDVSCVCPAGFVGDGDFCNGVLMSVLATNGNFSIFYQASVTHGS